MAWNIADLFEHTVDAVPDRVALVDGESRQTFAELDARANQLAHVLASAGIGHNDHVGIYAQNSHQWMEALLATYKLRAVPININFRYVADELSYLFENAELKGLVFDRQYAANIVEVKDATPGLNVFVAIDDGTEPTPELDTLGAVDMETAVAAASPERDFGERSPDDLYILYTGGTTGMPKGVMWRHEDVLFALGGGIDAVSGQRATHERELADRAAASEGQLVFMMIPPMMHGAGQWGSLTQMYLGHRIVLLPKFDPQHVWSLVESEGVNSLIITGDAMGRPMIEALEADPESHDTSSLISVSSTAAIFSGTVKDRYLERFPNLIITDSIGSTESGFNGITMVEKGQTQIVGGGPTVQPGRDTVLLDDDFNVIPPGDDRTGRVGRGGNIPIGYFNDPVKTAETFIVAPNGMRYSVPGDFARWNPDGQLVILGRGSVSINSGGEKIYPEEVEQALKAHPAVYDCLVVGVPDDRWGQRVAAVVEFRPGSTAELDDLAAHARKHVAGYKVPRELHVADRIHRAASGKPDYRWAQQLARGELSEER